MRAEVLDYISGLSLGSFALSQELPWEESGTTLYTKNLKRIYVSVTEYASEPLIRALNGLHINNETTSVSIFFSTDAKQIPANYDDLVSDLRLARDITSFEGVTRREANVATTIQNDMLITEITISLTKTI